MSFLQSTGKYFFLLHNVYAIYFEMYIVKLIKTK